MCNYFLLLYSVGLSNIPVATTKLFLSYIIGWTVQIENPTVRDLSKAFQFSFYITHLGNLPIAWSKYSFLLSNYSVAQSGCSHIVVDSHVVLLLHLLLYLLLAFIMQTLVIQLNCVITTRAWRTPCAIIVPFVMRYVNITLWILPSNVLVIHNALIL